MPFWVSITTSSFGRCLLQFRLLSFQSANDLLNHVDVRVHKECLRSLRGRRLRCILQSRQVCAAVLVLLQGLTDRRGEAELHLEHHSRIVDVCIDALSQKDEATTVLFCSGEGTALDVVELGVPLHQDVPSAEFRDELLSCHQPALLFVDDVLQHPALNVQVLAAAQQRLFVECSRDTTPLQHQIQTLEKRIWFVLEVVRRLGIEHGPHGVVVGAILREQRRRALCLGRRHRRLGRVET